MKVFTIHSAQHALFFKKFIAQDDFFPYAEQIKNHLATLYPTKKFNVEIPRINLSNILFRILCDEIMLQISLERCDVFWQNTTPLSSSINYTQVLDKIRKILSSLFTFFESKQQIVRVGTIVNCFLKDEEKSSSDILDDLLSKIIIKDSIHLTRLESKDTFQLSNFLANDVRQIFDGLYTNEQGKKISFIGLSRDINIALQTMPISIENYNSFLSETSLKFTEESMLSWGK